jgi:hypothetical protein
MEAFDHTGMHGAFGTNVQSVAGCYLPYLEVM